MINTPDARFRIPRIWSNQELKKVAHLFSGDVANISGGDDIDKEGSHYKDYFNKASSYTITNYGGASFRGFQDRLGEIQLDLTEPLPDNLRKKFDVVLNHTTLEHVFDVVTAFHNICEMTRDIAIVVVPFCQTQHESSAFNDFWRFTPTSIRELFRREGLETLYEASNEKFNESVYLFMIASRSPEKWINHIPKKICTQNVGEWIGRDCSLPELFKLPVVKEAGLLKLLKLVFSNYTNRI